MLTRKTPPSVGDAATDKVIRQLYNDINEVIDALNQASTTSGIEGGKPGEVRVEKNGSNYSVRFRSSDGWIEISDQTILKFKDRTT